MSQVKEKIKKTNKRVDPIILKSDDLETEKYVVGTAVEDRVLGDPLIESADPDMEEDEGELDEEELNPFRDKWEE
jgi:hypothetical protein